MQIANEARNEACVAECDSLLTKCLADMVQLVADEVVKESKALRADNFAKISKKCCVIRLRRFFNR